MESSQAFSEEINMHSLIPRMLEILIKSAGASKGAIVLIENEHWMVYIVDHQKLYKSELLSIRFEETNSLPKSIIRLTMRTREVLRSKYIDMEHVLRKDPYFERDYPKGLMCLPMVNKYDKLMGCLYLESFHHEDALSRHDLETLQLILGQTAAAIENAKLFDDLKKAKQEAESMNKLKTTFLSVMSHELKTPSTVFFGFC